MDTDAATQTMIDNLPARTGRGLEDWFAVLDAAGAATHGQAMTHLKSEHGMTHGYANLVVRLHRDRDRDRGPSSDDDLVDAQYQGAKAPLRPILDRILSEVRAFGEDVEVAPKKTGVSLRRSKQFALVEAPSARRVRVGLNLRGTDPTPRLALAGGMCTHRVDVGGADEVDAELLGWLREAYGRA